MCTGQLKCDGTHAETRFRLSAKRTSQFKLAGASVQSTTGSRGVRISGTNARYTMFRGSVKSTGYPLHSPVSLTASHFNWSLLLVFGLVVSLDTLLPAQVLYCIVGLDTDVVFEWSYALSHSKFKFSRGTRSLCFPCPLHTKDLSDLAVTTSTFIPNIIHSYLIFFKIIDRVVLMNVDRQAQHIWL